MHVSALKRHNQPVIPFAPHRAVQTNRLGEDELGLALRSLFIYPENTDEFIDHMHRKRIKVELLTPTRCFTTLFIFIFLPQNQNDIYPNG